MDYAEARKRSDEIQRFYSAESRGQTCLDYAEARKRSDEIQRIMNYGSRQDGVANRDAIAKNESAKRGLIKITPQRPP